MTRPATYLTPDGWTRVREHTSAEERQYGAATFWLLHWRTPREQRKGLKLIHGIFGPLSGRLVERLPEARRVYLLLCKKFAREPEAISSLTPAERKGLGS
jgi:hypothetical protein